MNTNDTAAEIAVIDVESGLEKRRLAGPTPVPLALPVDDDRFAVVFFEDLLEIGGFAFCGPQLFGQGFWRELLLAFAGNKSGGSQQREH